MMTPIIPRPYQAEGIRLGVDHMLHGKGNAFEVLPTGSGKSIVIAGVADELDGPVLVFQPSQEVLMQNYHKMRAFGHLPAIFSASAGKKQIAHITFATIGSVVNRMEAFNDFRHIIVDECHLFNPDPGGQYSRFMKHMAERNGTAPRILGVTATPYRLGSNSFGSQIRMLNRMKPKVWDKMLYYVQISELRKMGFLSDMQYFRTKGIDVEMLKFNSNGSDYTDASIKEAWKVSDMTAKAVDVVKRLLTKGGRKSVLVFVPTVLEAEAVAALVPGAEWVCGETPTAERNRIITDFRQGRIPCICNVGVLTTGFDYPELDTVVLARPTRSLSLYCQMVGRVMRPHPNKKAGWAIDMVGLVNTFGYMEDLEIGRDKKGLDCIYGSIPRKDAIPYRKQLTNTLIQPQQARQFARW
jgi:DNA repair protein RadD